jgi:rhodanese-related sulfurtransferase
MTRLPDIDPDRASNEVEQHEALLLDVRTAAEWAAGHAPDAVHIPLDNLTGDQVPADRPVLTICHTGGRSALAADRLAPTHRVRNVVGGMAAWEEKDLPVVSGDQSAS